MKKSQLKILIAEVLNENIRQAKQYVQQGKLSPEDLNRLVSIDPTGDKKKYVGWMAKQWATGNVDDWDTLKNNVEEFNVFLEKGRTKTKDIYQIKSFKELEKEVDNLNKTGAGTSLKDLESDYDVVVDNENLLIMSPHTHEASRKLGLSHFAYRDCGGGEKDSAWCTTYKAPDHFNDYYYSRNVTFYYIKVRSKQIKDKLEKIFGSKAKRLTVVALAVLEDGQIDGYDGLDKQINKGDIDKFTSIIGIS
jgi:hypothetical protein